MSFHEICFPEDIAYGSSGGPVFSTDIVTTHQGYEYRNIKWPQARARYNVAHGVKTQEQLNELIAFFRARKGKAIGFRFKDWTDFSATQSHLGIGDGTTKQFRLVKHYQSGKISVTRPIQKPLGETVQVFFDGIWQKNGLVIDETTGNIICNSAPKKGVIITASFEFHVPVRFDIDALCATIEAYGTYSWSDIPLIEVRCA